MKKKLITLAAVAIMAAPHVYAGVLDTSSDTMIPTTSESVALTTKTLVWDIEDASNVLPPWMPFPDICDPLKTILNPLPCINQIAENPAELPMKSPFEAAPSIRSGIQLAGGWRGFQGRIKGR